MFSYGAVYASGKNSPIKYVETFEVTIAAGASSATHTLGQSVNTARSYAYNNKSRCVDNTFNCSEHEVAVELTDNTTVTVRTGGVDATNSRTVAVQVVEWHDWAVKDVQRGTVTLGSGTSSADSSSLSRTVDPAYATSIHTGQTCTATTQNQDRCAATVTLKSDGTAVTGTRNGTTDSVTVYFAVIEWQPHMIKSRQQVTLTFSGTTQTSVVDISDVVPGQTLLFWGGCRQNAFQDDLVDVALTNGGADITATGGRSVSNNTRVAVVTAIEFNARFVKTKLASRDTIALSQTINDNTISAVNTNKTLIHSLGFSTNNDSSQVHYCSVHRTSSTNVRSQRATASALYTATHSWNGLEFYG